MAEEKEYQKEEQQPQVQAEEAQQAQAPEQAQAQEQAAAQEQAEAPVEQEESAPAGAEKAARGKKERRGKRGRVEVDAKELEEAAQKYQALMDSHMRLKAEFENFKRRKAEESSAARVAGVADAVREFLKVMDNMERAYQSAQEAGSESIANGIKMCIDSMFTAFARYDLKRIEADGEEFDPNFHEAVLQQPTDDEEKKGKVAMTMQTGYLFNGKVLRHSMVSVYA